MTTDPTTLAREVVRQHGHLDRDALSRREKERLDLARAVLAVADLADQMDDEAATCALDPDLDDSYEDGARDTAARIRTALNGGEK